VTTTLYRRAALADGTSERPRLGVSILVVDGRIAWIRPADDEGPLPAGRPPRVVDAIGSTIVPGLVDAHAHLVLPGGADWIARIDDAVDDLVAAAEHNARLLGRAGVRWIRDVGSPRVEAGPGRPRRALALDLRDAWRARAEAPYIRAAGTWLMRTGTLPSPRVVAVDDAEALLAAADTQLDEGADLVKLYLDGPEPGIAPWSVAEVERVVARAHERGARVTAHSGNLAGARVGVAAGVDALEHGFELDADVAGEMARRGTFLVSTLAVFRSWESFGATTTLPRFAEPQGRARTAARRERAEESLRIARAAGVRIATGTDFGGGSTRANQLAWEVEALVGAGLEPWEALAAATIRGGELLGEPDAGRLREGGPADLVLVHGDPLSDPAALWRAWRVSWLDDRACTSARTPTQRRPPLVSRPMAPAGLDARHEAPAGGRAGRSLYSRHGRLAQSVRAHGSHP
jgi:imidazolonepropionase-like amidohydrolase